ncbi:MAG TPA: cupin domain-containing protein [Candidatus Dormibacteraeota bacterium]|nr:cupin domain-containing protein [Candidatus Dormibacteraeota bacterium]
MSRQLWLAFLFLAAASAATPRSLPQMRVTPDEVRATTFDGSQAGSSAVAGVRSKVLVGDPASAGFYTILLFVPAHTTIQAHSHRDDRMAVVVSGEWHFGYGDHFDEKSLKTLPPGSIYSEPAGQTHFAQTSDGPAILEISGSGPTDTRYFDPSNDPTQKKK